MGFPEDAGIGITHPTTTADGWKSNVVIIPTDHNVTGTCGACGGPVICPVYWHGSGEPSQWCMNCGKRPKKIVEYPTYGPIREME